MEARVRDRVIVESNKVGGGRRDGEVVEAVSGPSGQHYRVRWDDGHETTFFPSSDARVQQHS